MKAKDMHKSEARYDFIYDGKQLVDEYDVELSSDCAAIARAFAEMGEMEYPPAHGADMTEVCSIYCTRDGSRAFVCNVNAEGEVDFINGPTSL